MNNRVMAKIFYAHCPKDSNDFRSVIESLDLSCDVGVSHFVKAVEKNLLGFWYNAIPSISKLFSETQKETKHFSKSIFNASLLTIINYYSQKRRPHDGASIFGVTHV